MNHTHASLCALFAAALALVTPHPASAVQLSTTTLTPSQIGSSGAVSLGHVATGRTNYNRLSVSGTYNVNCAGAPLVPIAGQRSLSTDNLGGPLTLVTTIPQVLPSAQEIPGFDLLPAGTVVACAYSWTSKAVEGGFNIGANGISFQSGNGEQGSGASIPFIMRKPGETQEDARNGGGCIP